jgi:hypothetical protein
MGSMPLLSEEDGDDRVQALPQLLQPLEAEAAGVPGGLNGAVDEAFGAVETVVVDNVPAPPDPAAAPAQQDAVSIATIPHAQSAAEAAPAVDGVVVEDAAAAAVVLVEDAAAPLPPERGEEAPRQSAAPSTGDEPSHAPGAEAAPLQLEAGATPDPARPAEHDGEAQSPVLPSPGADAGWLADGPQQALGADAVPPAAQIDPSPTAPSPPDQVEAPPEALALLPMAPPAQTAEGPATLSPADDAPPAVAAELAPPLLEVDPAPVALLSGAPPSDIEEEGQPDHAAEAAGGEEAPPAGHAPAEDWQDSAGGAPDPSAAAFPTEPAAAPRIAPLTGALDAATKLAADANAAAEALENLKRLLERQLPTPSAPPAAEPPPLPPLPLVPSRAGRIDDGSNAQARSVRLPAVVPVPPDLRRFDVRGFLAGFALSWAFGLVLYLFLTAG